jgi:Zn-dependent protease with chaperone function
MRIAIVVSIIVLSLGSFQAVWSQQALSYAPLADGNKDPLIKIAREQEEQFVRRGIRFNDPELQEIVNRVAENVVPVVADSFINYRVYLIRDPSPRGFSLADGQIYVHTGLLARLENEAQLAAVLAHEAHHIAAHHHIQANDLRRSKGKLAGISTAMLNRNASEGVSYDSDLDDIAQTVFSDEMEFEADAGSVALLVRSGYAPAATVQTLARLRQDPELTAELQTTASFNTPESLTERQGRLQELIDGLQEQYAHLEKAEGRPLQLRRVIDMTIDDYIRLDRPGTAVELIDAMIAEQPDAFLYAAKGDSHLALGSRPIHELQAFSVWVVDGKRAEKTRDEMAEKYLAMEGGPERLAHNLESAAIAYDMAIQLDENNARAYRGLGNMYYEQKDYRQAGRNYVKYVKLAPEADDRPFVLENLQVIKTELTKQTETEK